MSKQILGRTRNSKKLLSPKAGALCGKTSKLCGNPPFVEMSPIRTELLAHDIAKVNLAKQIPIESSSKLRK